MNLCVLKSIAVLPQLSGSESRESSYHPTVGNCSSFPLFFLLRPEQLPELISKRY